LPTAVHWYRQAAEAGEARAQISLAQCYATGRGIDKDAVHAIFWARKAADQGVADAKPLIQSLAIAQFSQGSLRRQAAAQMAKEALRDAKAGVTP